MITKKNILITGQSGFIGTHFSKFVKNKKELYNLIDFQDHYFQDEEILNSLVTKSDVILHLAAVNRHNDPDYIYKTNLFLVDKLINACLATNSKPHIIFSSSTQEERDNPYGISKREGRNKFVHWSKETGGLFTGLIIPNVFGPNGKPFYNSVVATFCYQIANNQKPKIEVDAELKLIYVHDLIQKINQIIQYSIISDNMQIQHSVIIKVSEILRTLEYLEDTYIKKKEIPSFQSSFEKNLFDTFISYLN